MHDCLLLLIGGLPYGWILFHSHVFGLNWCKSLKCSSVKPLNPPKMYNIPLTMTECKIIKHGIENFDTLTGNNENTQLLEDKRKFLDWQLTWWVTSSTFGDITSCYRLVPTVWLSIKIDYVGTVLFILRPIWPIQISSTSKDVHTWTYCWGWVKVSVLSNFTLNIKQMLERCELWLTKWWINLKEKKITYTCLDIKPLQCV